MHKIQTYIYARSKGQNGKILVTAYTRDKEFCIHRNPFRPTRWHLTHIFSGLSDGVEYKTRENALVHYCENSWHEKCQKAAEKCTKPVTDYPTIPAPEPVKKETVFSESK